MVLRGELSPTTANHDFKQQEYNANTEKSSVCQPRALNPRPEGQGPVALSGRPSRRFCAFTIWQVPTQLSIGRGSRANRPGFSPSRMVKELKL
jgi:hypothetical protein